jgi:hypothetical protein
MNTACDENGRYQRIAIIQAIRPNPNGIASHSPRLLYSATLGNVALR